MRQPINMTQTDINEVADKASGLSAWLQEGETAGDARTIIPHRLMTIASFIVTSGVLVYIDKLPPTSVCWGGGCAG